MLGRFDVLTCVRATVCLIAGLAFIGVACVVDDVGSSAQDGELLDIHLEPGEAKALRLEVVLDGEPRSVSTAAGLLVGFSHDSNVQVVDVHVTGSGFDQRAQFDRNLHDRIDFSELVPAIPSTIELDVTVSLVSGEAGEVTVDAYCSVSAQGAWEAELTMTLEEVP